MTKRLHALDYLRGLVAVGIMCYHFLFWMYGAHSAHSFLGRLGIYGVSIFYVLSGLTLYHVYESGFQLNRIGLSDFWKKRILRIYPLFWLAIFLTIWQRHQWPKGEDLALNLTGLFGFIKWDKYLAVGAWSIGNELVFYVFFPLVLLCGRNFKSLFVFIGALLLVVYIYFAFYVLDDQQSLGTQWRMYIHPLNQAFLFYGGMAISWAFKNRTLSAFWSILLIVIPAFLFVWVPSGNDAITLVSSYHRIYFTVLVMMMCLGFYKLTLELPKIIHSPIIILGEISFTMYLLHPLVYRKVQDVFYKMPFFNKQIGFCIAFIFTLICSYVVYMYFEKFFVKLGKSKKK